jgi:hypothetical protein
LRDSAKAKRSTFANFIHQKNASIACYVFDHAYSKGVPLYSVHNCFVVPAGFATFLPHVYLKAFTDLVHPLHLINCLFIHNIFVDVPQEEGD